MIVSGTSRGHGHTWTSVLAIVERRKYLIAVPIVAGLVVGIAGYSATPPAYVSEAVVALDVRRVHALPAETVVSPLPQDSPVLRTEIDIITSRSMAAKVVAQLERDGAVIGSEDNRPDFFGGLRRYVKEWLRNSGGSADHEETDIYSIDDRQQIDRLLSRIQVSNDGRSYTIYLTFSSTDPVFAAKVANTYALAYLEHQIEVQRSTTRRVSDWLGETLINLRADLESSEQAAESFRQKAGLVETNGAILQAQRVSALNSELATARSDFAGLQARLETIKRLSSTDDFPSLTEILDSETVQSLRIDEARLERRLRELQDSRAVKSLEISRLTSELASLKAQIKEEIARIIESLTNEMSILRQKEKSIEAALREARTELSTANHAEVTLAQLEREAAANRTIYESYLVRYKQTIEQDGIAAPEAQIISKAVPASRPAAPRLSAWLLFGLGFGGSAAVAAVALREATDRRHQLHELLENATAVPVIGTLPRLTRRQVRRMPNEARDASTTVGRSLSTIRKLLHITPVGVQSLTVVVTSTYANEGKTTLTVNLARSAAAAGMRAVVVDANMRTPGIEAILGGAADTYLDELAGANKSAAHLVQHNGERGISFIAARKHAVAPELLLASPRFRALINELRQSFDVVLIDTPDLAVASDALDVAAVADRVLFVAGFESRRIQWVLASIRSLTASGHKPDGIVLNRVNIRSQLELSEQLLRHAPIIEGTVPANSDVIKQRA